MNVLDKDIDVHVLTGTLKLFFRELKEPLIPFRLFQRILNASCEYYPLINRIYAEYLSLLLTHITRNTEKWDKMRLFFISLFCIASNTGEWEGKRFKKLLISFILSANPILESRTKEFRDIVNSLPECNRQTLKYLLEHLLRYEI